MGQQALPIYKSSPTYKVKVIYTRLSAIQYWQYYDNRYYIDKYMHICMFLINHQNMQ